MSENDLPPIAYGELIERLSDPDSDLDHYMGYMIEVPIPGRMGPELRPNPALVKGLDAQIEGGALVSLANGFMRRRRHRAYRRRIRGGWSGPRFVSEGDSWFQYPTRLQDIIDHLMKDNAILSLGAAGDELKDIRRQREILLNIDAEGASALLLSAGGNDLFDNGQLGRLIEPVFPGASGAELVGPTFDTFLQGMVAQYLDLFRRVHRAFPKVHILIHGYGPAFPRDGAWIEKPLTKAGVPLETQHEVVVEILTRFNATLKALAARPEFHGRLVHIDVTNIGTHPDDWHDEIHLDGPNCKKVADAFQTVLDARMEAGETESLIAASPPAEVTQAVQMAALDQKTLLRELDLRVRLIELDPTAREEGDLPLLFADMPEPELGIATIQRATRKLIDRWLADLREVVCGGAAPDNLLEKAIVEAFDKGKETLAAAVSAWLVTGPFGVPAAVAGALAAWLAGEALEMGQDALCATWKPSSPPVTGAAIETSIPTMAEARAVFRRADGTVPKFDADFRKDELEMLREAVYKDAVDAPDVPVDGHAAEAFMAWASTILKTLGGEADDVPPPEGAEGTMEALVAVDGSRPALYVRDDTIDLDAPVLERSGMKLEIVPRLGDIERQIKATGRILRGFDRSADDVYGSAWMLADGRVATAQHVLEAMTFPMGDGLFLNATYFVDFAVEADRDERGEKLFRIEAPDFISSTAINGLVHPPNLDVATLKLVPNGLADFPDPVPLAPADAVLADDALLLNVGHPGAPEGSWLVEEEDGNPKTLARPILHALIGNKFGVKRFSPGRVIATPGIYETMGGHAGSVFLHDATTLGGSSGSSLMADGPQGMVMAGLHFAGKFGTRNYAHYVPAIRDSFEGGTG